MAHRIPSILQAALLVLIGLMIALALAEVTVRMFFPEPILPRYVIDAGYGVRANQPNIVTRHYVPGDYDVIISTNSAGMRGAREYTLEKSENVCRVAVIGDSFVFGFGVNDNEVISAVLEGLLNKEPGTSMCIYEVINFSVSGFGQAEELVTYQERISQYSPDYVVLFYFSNDIGNNSVSRLFSVENGQLTRTGSVYLPGVKAREALYGYAPTRWLFTHSQAWNLVRNRLSKIVQNFLLKEQGLKTFNDTIPEAVDLTRSLLLEFVEETKKDGASSAIFLIPQRTQQTNFPLNMVEVEESGTVFIDGRLYLSPGDYYVQDPHWRPSGHRKAAAAVAQRLFGNVTEMESH